MSTQSSANSGFGTGHTMYIGKEMHSVPSIKLAATTAAVWQKQSSLNQLFAVIETQKGSHSIADLITAVSKEIPINTGNAYAEAMEVKQKVMQQIFDVRYLRGMDFLSSQGIPKLLTSILTAKRPADLAYFRFTVTLDGKDVDAEVTKDAVTLQFCLKLPQTFFGDGATADEEIEDMVRDYSRQKEVNEGKDEAENEDETEDAGGTGEKDNGSDNGDEDPDDEEQSDVNKTLFMTPKHKCDHFSVATSPKMSQPSS